MYKLAGILFLVAIVIGRAFHPTLFAIIAFAAVAAFVKAIFNTIRGPTGPTIKCARAMCTNTITEETMRYGGKVIETSDGPRFYCSQTCVDADGYYGQGY